MLEPVLSIEERDFLQQLPSQGTAEQQAISRILNRQSDVQIHRFLQNLHCKLLIRNRKNELGESNEKSPTG